MGEVAILHPQSCFMDHLPRPALIRLKARRNAIPNPNTNPSPNPNTKHARSNRRKRSPEKKKKNDGLSSNRSSQTAADHSPAKNLVLGRVKILKRGQELTAALENPLREGEESDLAVVVSPTDLLGSEPEAEIAPPPSYLPLPPFYAGSAFFSSPPPSSLPLPAFFSKKCVLGANDDASTDLRRLLRLDLL